MPKSIATHDKLSDSASANHAEADAVEERCHQTTYEKGKGPFDSFQVLVESLPHPVYVIDAHDFTIKYANPAAGLSDIDAHSKCYKVIHGLSKPCSQHEHQCPLKMVKETRQPCRVEHIRTGPSGDDQVLHIHTYPILDSDGEVSAVAEYYIDVTDQNRARREVQASERLSAITRSAHDAIIMMDHDGAITFWNPAAKKMFGHSESEAIGQDCHSLLMPEEYRELFVKGFKQFRETGTGPAVGKTIELEAVRKDGSRFPISISVSGMRVQHRWHAVGIVRDITEQQQREQQFQREVSRYMAMIDTVPAMVYLKDIDHRYMVANRAFRDKVGMPLDELVGKTDYDIFPWDTADSYHLSDKAVMDKDRQVTDHEQQIKDAEGVTRWIVTTKVPLHDSQGLVSGVVGLVQDVTDYHRSREQLVQADKLAAIGTLAAGVAHEINNPIGFISSNLNTMTKYLNKIRNYVEMATPGQDEDKDSLLEILTDFVDAVDESTEGTTRVKNIVVDLKSFSRVDRAEKEHANLNEGLESTLNMVWNELKYHCTVEKDLGDIPELYCIPNQLNQVIMNMLVNAGHATKNTEGRIRIRTWADAENILISIGDNGTGIPTENVNKIFEPFFTTKDVGSGTGLGLSLAYDIVKKHGGTISVSTDIGVGTEFVISLPLEGIRDD